MSKPRVRVDALKLGSGQGIGKGQGGAAERRRLHSTSIPATRKRARSISIPTSPDSSSPQCPLCSAGATEDYFTDGERTYFRCASCALIHLNADARLAPEEEVARYREHNNVVGDPAYEEFLNRLWVPLRARLLPGATGLDFGCGPAKALESMMFGAGFATESYDPYFHPDDSLLARRYDFIACSEVVEHLFDPAATFELLDSLLVSGGVLGVMTRMYGHEAPFAEWWYRRDPTHVCFYNEDTMRWIAGQHGWSLEFPRTHVAIFQKNSSQHG